MTTAAATHFLPVVSTASRPNNSLVVSLHDIAPSTREIAEKILSELGRHGIHVCSLLVVPDYHHQHPIKEDRQFISWLRGLESEGYEVVIHGYFHKRPRREHETLRERFITRFYTQEEGEFFDLDYAEALRRITRARDEFREIGLSPRGFVAPAWLLSMDAEKAARDAEMEYTTRLGTIHDLRSGEDFPGRSLVYSVRSGWRRNLSLIWNAGLCQLLRHESLLRLSIHPADYSHPAVWSQILRFIDNMRLKRTPTTYQDWVGERRARGTRRL